MRDDVIIDSRERKSTPADAEMLRGDEIMGRNGGAKKTAEASFVVPATAGDVIDRRRRVLARIGAPEKE